MSKKRILLTNDDGIEAAGLRAMWSFLKEDHDLAISAPDYHASGAALSTSYEKQLISKKTKEFDETPAWAVSSTPADCVRFGMHYLLKDEIDYVFSGINKGLNAGMVTLYSGTVGAAIEGATRGVSSIAFSIDHNYWSDLEGLRPYFLQTIETCFAINLPPKTLLNVNFPNVSPRGIRLTRQGETHWEEKINHSRQTEEEIHFEFYGGWDLKEDHLESDVQALAEGFISITPLYIGELTHHPTIDALRGNGQNLILRFFDKPSIEESPTL